MSDDFTLPSLDLRILVREVRLYAESAKRAVVYDARRSIYQAAYAASTTAQIATLERDEQ